MRIAAPLALLLVLAGCGKYLPTEKWEESIARATEAWNKKDFGKAADLCQRAFDQAATARNGDKALQALECLAEASWLEGKPRKVFAAHVRALGEFSGEFRAWIGRHRLRNNYALALLEAGRRDDAIVAFEAALDAYEDTPYHSAHDYRARMVIVTNLGRLAQPEPEGALGMRVSTELLDELRSRMVRFGRTPTMLQGVGDALEPIAEIVRKRGDPQDADALLAIAKERREADLEELGAGARVCHRFAIRLLALETCMREIPRKGSE